MCFFKPLSFLVVLIRAAQNEYSELSDASIFSFAQTSKLGIFIFSVTLEVIKANSESSSCENNSYTYTLFLELRFVFFQINMMLKFSIYKYRSGSKSRKQVPDAFLFERTRDTELSCWFAILNGPSGRGQLLGTRSCSPVRKAGTQDYLLEQSSV